jgi:hypothetical protein
MAFFGLVTHGAKELPLLLKCLQSGRGMGPWGVVVLVAKRFEIDLRDSLPLERGEGESWKRIFVGGGRGSVVCLRRNRG